MQKSVLKSKTFWMGVVTAVAPLFPTVGNFASANIGAIGVLWGAIAIVLRLVTKDKVILVD